MSLLTFFFIELPGGDHALEERPVRGARGGGIPADKHDDRDDCKKAEDTSGEQPCVPYQS
jgi:hypothetical protein